MALKDEIKAAAKGLGFSLVGVTHPDSPPHIDVFEAWLKAGRHGEMSYLSTERSRVRRADPLQILPECQSILVLGMPHSVPDPPARGGNDSNDLQGRIAAYAWGDDYHEVIPERLKELVAFIEDRLGRSIPNRWYTDTGPIMEHDLAQRAGLGWIGKNTCLINPSQGSYFLLAVILLGVYLEPDPQFIPDHCGTCQRCLDACPTSCILPDRTIDARRCISYLTIELKGPIPMDLRDQTGNWVFGCDICQQVCPWNERFASPGRNLVFEERPEVPTPDLITELSLSPQEFNRKFEGSPVKRAKRRGYMRNVAVALGNSKQVTAIQPLKDALTNDPEPLVRQHAAWALSQIEHIHATQALTEALSTEDDPLVIAEIRSSLER
jgi:epoxyqueuosine reductase